MHIPNLTLCSIIGLALGGALALGCGIDDTDRCGDALTYDEARHGCVALATDAGASTMDAGTSTTTDAGGDSASAGVGDSCTSDADCAGNTADFCLLDPTMPGTPGICTIDGCAAATDCGAPDFACCDCAAVALISWPEATCVPSANAAQVTGLGCSCN